MTSQESSQGIQANFQENGVDSTATPTPTATANTTSISETAVEPLEMCSSCGSAKKRSPPPSHSSFHEPSSKRAIVSTNPSSPDQSPPSSAERKRDTLDPLSPSPGDFAIACSPGASQDFPNSATLKSLNPLYPSPVPGSSKNPLAQLESQDSFPMVPQPLHSSAERKRDTLCRSSVSDFAIACSPCADQRSATLDSLNLLSPSLVQGNSKNPLALLESQDSFPMIPLQPLHRSPSYPFSSDYDQAVNTTPPSPPAFLGPQMFHQGSPPITGYSSLSLLQVYGDGDDDDDDSLVAEARELLTSFELIDHCSSSVVDRDTVLGILVVYDILRRKIESAALKRRHELFSGEVLMKRFGIRTNSLKRIGEVPGVVPGDIFFYRTELRLIGLHFPSMSGIDFLKVNNDNIAVSIVSSGEYDDDGSDNNVLTFSGSGGKMEEDQNLTRGNLAMHNSFLQRSAVRVIQGIRDVLRRSGKVYVYDGLYKVSESKVVKNKYGSRAYRFTLNRLEGHSSPYTTWISLQQPGNAATYRAGVVMRDLTSGYETRAVSVFNDIDNETAPSDFSYIRGLKYAPAPSHAQSLFCRCKGSCKSGDLGCCCIQKNGGLLPYNSGGVLMTYGTVIHECGVSCSCSSTCRNRWSKVGLRFRLEVFRTVNRGWGPRSIDPIRAGSFICEYAGEVLQKSDLDNEDEYIFDSSRIFPLPGHVTGDATSIDFPLVISSKKCGNICRFINHSCSPNSFWQSVQRQSYNQEANIHLYIAIFAMHHIAPLEEITLDYGIVTSDEAGFRSSKECLCKHSNCRGFFY